MARPPRNRPSGQSPILDVQVEQVRMPVNDATDAGDAQSSPEQPPAPTAPPSPTPPPDRASASTAATTESPGNTPSSTRSRRRRVRQPADYLVGPKATTSLQLHVELKARAETAVLRTAGQEGGARSLTALLNEAVAREVMRLEDELNGGEPFEPNRGAFRMGRPFGS